ncbi:S8 family serine peptidase [Streptomyces poriferorum]|uniref:S8 family serine peptidase n=1 Tax=Streptomyces poriferorum TaxID=2798799 RepID=UPI00273D3739|nr:S8 family serine peptidase [Streptomyces sp. Alt1]WLQ52506.1 S8 family serine peptidase [Streptomyces sp. Alt1]
MKPTSSKRRGARRTGLPRAWALLLAAGLAAAGLPAVATAAPAAPGQDPGPVVERKVAQDLAGKGRSTFWVYFKDKADLTAAARIKDRARQGREVRSRLVKTATTSQAGLIDVLHKAGANRSARTEAYSYTPYWLANTVQVNGDSALLAEIEKLPGVERVTADRTYALPKLTTASAEPAVEDVEWGVDRIGAPKVWDEYGAAGQGIVVGSIDSGAQFDHPALVKQYRGNNGDGTFTHDYNWYDPGRVCGIIERIPCDNVGHGTHTIGTMVGDDGPGNHVGVAPEAQWISAKGCEVSSCSQRSLLAAGQFMLAPTDVNGKNPRPELRPHVVNNSWGSADAEADPWFKDTVTAWVAAGIFPVFSNGNEGPSCATDGNPGNLKESYGVGAFDPDGNVASFSSRGPSAFGDDLIKPNVSAPGVAIRSTYPGGKYAVGSGTSMAAPHVAGAIALLWSAAPSIARDVDETRRLLDETAVDVDDVSCGGTAGNNNVYGQGRLDAYAAVTKAPRGATGTVTGVVTDAENGEPLADVTVGLRDGEGHPVGLARTTGADGRYTMPASVSSYSLSASAPAYDTRTTAVEVSEGNTTTADVALTARKGKVLDMAVDRTSFGTVPIGTTGGPVTVTLTSNGSRPVTVWSVTDHDHAFVHEAGTCGFAPFTLARKEHCTVEISFRPTAKGDQQGTVSLRDTATYERRNVTVSGTGAVVPARTDTLRMNGTERNMDAAVADPEGRYAYFGTSNAMDPLPGHIAKVDLKTFKRVGTASVGIGQKLLQAAVMDPAGKYAYFAVAANPGRVVRIDLASFTMDKILVLDKGEDNLRSAVIDPAGKYAYFGTGTNPGRVVKVDLETFTRVGAVTLGAGEEYLSSGVIDPAGAFAYFGTLTYPQGHVVKIDLATMKETGSLALPEGQSYLRSAVMDPGGAYAYFGTGEGSGSGKVARVDLSSFEHAGTISPSGGGAFFSAVIDPAGRYASFATLSVPGRVVNIDLERFEGDGFTTLGTGEDALISGVVDARGDYSYFGTMTGPGQVVKVRTGARYEMKAVGSRWLGLRSAALTWNGATTEKVEVVRDGKVVATVPNTGRYTDRIAGRGRPSYTYRLCDVGTRHCSTEAEVDFTGPGTQAVG